MNTLCKLLSPPVLMDLTRFSLYAITEVSTKPKYTHTSTLDFKIYTFCVQFFLDQWVGRLGRSTARELCSLDLALVDRAVDRQRASALCIQASVDRGTTVGNLTVGDRPTGRPTAGFLLSWTPTDIFFRPINWGCFGLFSTRF